MGLNINKQTAELTRSKRAELETPVDSTITYLVNYEEKIGGSDRVNLREDLISVSPDEMENTHEEMKENGAEGMEFSAREILTVALENKLHGSSILINCHVASENEIQEIRGDD